jgi:predicted transcriptional regulator
LGDVDRNFKSGIPLILKYSQGESAYMALSLSKQHHNRNKEAIVEYVTNNPGCILSHIIRNESISEGTARYHVKRLEAEGKIILRRMGKYVRIFNASHATNDTEKLIFSFINNETDKKLLFAILEGRGPTNKALSESFHMSKSSTYKYLKKYLNNRLVEFKLDGRHKKYFLRPEIKDILSGREISGYLL